MNPTIIASPGIGGGYSPAVRRKRKKSVPPGSERQHPLVIRLRKYAQHFGDFEELLLEAAQKIHRQATSSDASMRERIVRAIHEGCNSVYDIVEDTQLDESAVRRIYSELIADGEYEERPMGQKTDSSKRRPKGIFLKTSSPGDSCRVFDNARTRSHYQNEELDDED